jgi:hypothetical protein
MTVGETGRTPGTGTHARGGAGGGAGVAVGLGRGVGVAVGNGLGVGDGAVVGVAAGVAVGHGVGVGLAERGVTPHAVTTSSIMTVTRSDTRRRPRPRSSCAYIAQLTFPLYHETLHAHHCLPSVLLCARASPPRLPMRV